MHRNILLLIFMFVLLMGCSEHNSNMRVDDDINEQSLSTESIENEVENSSRLNKDIDTISKKIKTWQDMNFDSLEKIVKSDTSLLKMYDSQDSSMLSEKLKNDIYDTTNRIDIEHIVFIDDKGIVIYDPLNELDGFDLSIQQYFQKALSGEKASSRNLTSRKTGQMMNVFAIPVEANDEVIGVAVMVVYLDEISELITESNIEENYYIVVCDDNGIINYSNVGTLYIEGLIHHDYIVKNFLDSFEEQYGNYSNDDYIIQYEVVKNLTVIFIEKL